MSVVALKLPKPALKIRCCECGVEQHAACECGVGFAPVKALDAAVKSILADPGLSNVVIAARIGVDEATVRRARAVIQPRQPADVVEQRLGQDGKVRKLPVPLSKRQRNEKAEAKAAAEQRKAQRSVFLRRMVVVWKMADAAFEGKADAEMLRATKYTAAKVSRLVEKMEREVAE